MRTTLQEQAQKRNATSAQQDSQDLLLLMVEVISEGPPSLGAGSMYGMMRSALRISFFVAIVMEYGLVLD